MEAKALSRLTNQLVLAMRDHILTGRPTRIPDAGHPVWRAFVALSRTRSYNEGVPKAAFPVSTIPAISQGEIVSQRRIEFSRVSNMLDVSV